MIGKSKDDLTDSIESIAPTSESDIPKKSSGKQS